MGAGAPCHADGTRTRHRAVLSGLHSSPPTTFSAGTFIFYFFSPFSGRFCALSSKVTRETHSTYHSVNIEMLFISIREALRWR